MDGRELVRASPEEVSAALRRAATAGPFFTVEHSPPPASAAVGTAAATGAPSAPALSSAATVPSVAGPVAPVTASEPAGVGAWAPASALVRPGAELAAAVESVRRWASDTRPRVAASLFLMSYSGRLLSAAVAGVLLGRTAVDLRAHEWRYVPGTGLQLRLPTLTGWRPPAPGGPPADRGLDALLAVLGDELVDGHLALVVEAIRGVVPVAAGLLWGNAASSLAGALQGLAAAGVGVPRCREVGDALLGHPRLRDTGAFTGPGLAFRRRSCCLFYLLPTSGKCADCALLPNTRRPSPAHSRW